MRVRHPEGDDYVDVFGTRVPVDENDTFPIPDRQAESFLNQWCERNGYDREAVVIDADADSDDAITPDAVETMADDVIADHLDRGECPWCHDYEGDHVAQHAASAHTDAWQNYQED